MFPEDIKATQGAICYTHIIPWRETKAGAIDLRY